MSRLKTKKMKHSSVQFADVIWWIIRIAVVVAIIFGVYTFFSGRVTHLEFASDALPKQFIRYKIGNVTCIHNKSNNRIISQMRSAKPNVIVVSGGIADENGNINTGVSVLNQLQKIAPTYYVLQDSDMPYADAIISGTSATYLSNEGVMLSDATMNIDTYLAAVMESADANNNDAEIYTQYVTEKFQNDAGKSLALMGLSNYDNAEAAKFGLYDLVEAANNDFNMLILPQIQYFNEISVADVEIGFAGGNHGNADVSGGYTTGVFANNGMSLFIPMGFAGTPDLPKQFWKSPSAQVIELTDNVYGQDNIFSRITRKLMPDVDTIFENDGGFVEYKYAWENLD